MPDNSKAIQETVDALLSSTADTAAPQQERLPALAGRRLPPSLPVMMNVREIAPELLAEANGLATPMAVDASFSAAPPDEMKKRQSEAGALLEGLKDLQQLQKQTLVVLESVKGALDDIAQVLRSPEATRGMERQRNAVMLLSKGFAGEAVEQAQGAVGLLPANPEAHLLLSLSLAANRQWESSLAAARKGLALFDRRAHPLAIEAGLLHAIAALGCEDEAALRWSEIIEGLPLPVLFEQMGRIAACFPEHVAIEIEGIAPDCENLLDDLFCRRLARDEQNDPQPTGARRRPRVGRIELRPDEIPATTLFAALDAAHEHALVNTHRAVLGQIARRLQLLKDSGPTEEAARGGDVIKFINECVIPLGNRGLDKSAAALARAAVKRLLHFHADAMTLYRAMGKLQMAGTAAAIHEIAALLQHWRKVGNKVTRARACVSGSYWVMMAGAGAFLCALLVLGAMSGKFPVVEVGMFRVPTVLVGPALMVLGASGCLVGMISGGTQLILPAGRGNLSREERTFLNTADAKHSLRGILGRG